MTNVALQALNDTRIQLHWAAQVLDGLTKANAERHPLWQHIALRHGDDGAWRTVAMGPNDVRGALDMATATLRIQTGAGAAVAFRIDGATLDELRQRVEDTARAHGLEGAIQLRGRDGMPDHAILDGAPIGIDAAAAERLHELYDLAGSTLGARADRLDDAQPALLWPHHFDISTMRTVEAGERDDAEDARTVTLGFSPGDASYEEPYWYVTPWPYPEPDALPELAGGGGWHTEGWTGAVLRQSVIDAGDGDVQAFLENANAAAERVARNASFAQKE